MHQWSLPANRTLLLAVWITTSINVYAEPVYSVTDLGALTDPSGRTDARPNSINQYGRIAAANGVGSAYRAFLYETSWTPLGTLGGAESYAVAINDLDQVVGYSTTGGGARHAFLWTPDGTNGVAGNMQMNDLGTLGGSTSEAYGINDSGQITGYSQTGGFDHAFFLSDGTMTDIGLLLAGSTHSYGFDINTAGHIAGTAYDNTSGKAVAFVYDGATVVEIPGWNGGDSTALSITDSDVIAGYAVNSDGFDHAFRYAGGVMTDLGTLGGHYSYGVAINNYNIVVGGAFVDSRDSNYHAFIAAGNLMTDLNSQLDNTGTGWSLTEARSINDAGQIVGVGKLNGVNHGFLLSPIAPPAPTITQIKTDGTDVLISFTTVATGAYSVETRTNADTGTWNEVVGPVPGSGDVLTVTNSGALDLPAQFYRIKSVFP